LDLDEHSSVDCVLRIAGFAGLCREPYKKTLSKEGFAVSQLKNFLQKKNTWQRGFFAESQPKNSQ
jgi:hypothetical protein